MNKPTAIEKEILEHIEYLLADTYGRNSFTKPLAKDLFQIAQKYAEMRVEEIWKSLPKEKSNEKEWKVGYNQALLGVKYILSKYLKQK